MSAKISVIIPVYNGEKYIDSIVACIMQQTFRDLQMIFVNDGSKDASANILRKYAQMYPECVTVVTQDNQGVSAARNAGLACAEGEYIAFIDVDDLIHPCYFEFLYRYASKRKGCIAVVGLAKSEGDFEPENTKVIVRSGVTLLEDFLYGRVSTGVWGMLIPKRLMDEHKLLFKEGYKYSEDLHMVWRLFCHAEEVTFIDAPLYIYLDTPGSAMTKINANRLDSLYLMQDLEVYFEKNKPEFAEKFKQHGVARMAWSLLWQAAHYQSFTDFSEFVKIYDFDSEMKKLRGFPDKRVTLSSFCYLLSKRVYYCVVSVLTRSYRR